MNIWRSGRRQKWWGSFPILYGVITGHHVYRSFGVNEIATSEPIQIFVSATFASVFFLRHRAQFFLCRKKKTKEIGPETKICIGSEVARAPLACLWSGGHRRCEKCEIKRKTEPVGPVSSQNLSFWWFGSLSAKTRLAEMTHRSQILWIRWNSLPFCHIQRKYFVIPKAAVV